MTAQNKEFLFSVIVPVYNVEPWIDTFFMSLVKQTSGLGDIIQVIIVDDGSTDRSAELTKKWAAQHPDNILYVRKENGGLSSARNHGLQFVKGKWVTFSDPADFLHEDYFAVVKDFLERTAFDGILIGCNLITYNEVVGEFFNNHPLSFKFSDDEKVIDLMQSPELIQLSAISSFINYDILIKSKFNFDENIKPTFTDTNLINKLFIYSNNYKAAYLKNAVYYYRFSQIIDKNVSDGWSCWEKYKDQIFYGYLHLVKYATHKLGSVPEFIQNIIVYETQLYMNKMLEGEIDYKFSKDQRGSFLDLMTLLYGYINAQNVLFCKLPLVPWRTRIALLSAFKGLDLPEAPAVIHEIAPDKRSMLLIRYGREKAECTISDESGEHKPLWAKDIYRDFHGVPLCVEQYLWVPIDEAPKLFKVNGVPVALIAGGNLITDITAREVLDSIYRPESALPERISTVRNAAESPAMVEKFEGCWLFMDRQDKADDNAEHLYRWVMHNAGRAQKIYYVLDRSSPDWNRLAQEGFNLIPYRSRQFHIALFNAEWVLSSHYQPHVFDPMYIRDVFGFPSYKFAFLQHGIMTHDMSKWVLSKRMDLFVTSTAREYASIVDGKYKSTEREVVLTGLPRHDELLRRRAGGKKEKIILVCPTWREHLCKPHIHDRPETGEIARFIQSDYYRNWNAVTSSMELASIANKYGYKFIFLPHPYASRLTELFECSECFTTMRYSDLETLQDMLAKSAMLITDYSSVGMEAAFVGLPLIYFQFKESPAFFSSHTVVNGYFSYERDGFGPVATDVDNLISYIGQSLAAGCERQEPYESKASDFFTLRDGLNCKRVYDELLTKSSPAYAYDYEHRDNYLNFA